MKKSLALIFFFTTIIYSGKAQKNLNENPVFSELAQRNIQYPINAIKNSLYGRIYTKFTVDKIGKISNVEVVHPTMTSEYEKALGFQRDIKRGLSKLPLLGIGYEGEYILPIAFIYFNHKDHHETSYPTNRLPNSYDATNITFLNELKIMGRSDTYPSLNSAILSKQIDEQ
jgi:hypothetical protein